MSASPAGGRRAGTGRGTSSGAIVAPTYRGTPGGGSESRERRWVLYKGAAEASKVPAEWHGWLHHTARDVPVAGAEPKYSWQKPHQPNLTGTPLAYRPPGSVLKGGQRAPTTGDYEP